MGILLKHRSIRNYKDTPIEEAVLQNVLNAATRASNTGNMQVYSIIVTKNKNLRNQLWEAHFKQPMVQQAPIHLTFCADINRFNKWCKLNNTEPGYDNFLWLYNATIDAILASQNACIAAEENGLGICYLGTTTYMADKIIDVLKLPKGVVPVTSVVMGYPNESPELTDRLPVNGVVHNETYQDYSDERISEIYYEKDNSEETKALIKENETINLAQIFTQKRYKKDDNVHFSKSFLNVLKKQGFMNQ